MSKTTLDLDTIASAKVKLAEELKRLEEQESQLRQEQAADAFAQVAKLLNQYGANFSARQKSEIASLVGAGSSSGAAPKPKKSSRQRGKVAPKYWLPHSSETWTGRGRTPKAFEAWVGTAAYNEWKARHPDEKFPAYIG